MILHCGTISPAMETLKRVSEIEKIDLKTLKERIDRGEVVILKNRVRKNVIPLGIGKGLRTKVNTNIGTSPERNDLEFELKKLKIAVEAGTDTVMDLSTAGDLDLIRKEIIRNCTIPLGTVPIYQAAVETIKEKGSIVKMDEDKIFEVIEQHLKDGVDFITVHCGVTQKVLKCLREEGRTLDIVSRGGAFHATWMITNKKENPLYEHFDQLLKLAKKYDAVLSLGDGLRPGSIADSTDRAQIEELITLGELTQEARDKGVQVIIEGPGHVPLNEIETNVLLEKKICYNAPFYVLGPLVTDVAMGYDHISASIGAAVAAGHGADFICYVTPGEHLRLPTLEDVKLGVIGARIAAHAGDIAKGIKGAEEWDEKMSKKRKKRDWKAQINLSIDPKTAKRLRGESTPAIEDVCTMCGEYCSIKIVADWFKNG
jgi:phosphomethylpyrimidine synthase